MRSSDDVCGSDDELRWKATMTMGKARLPWWIDRPAFPAETPTPPLNTPTTAVTPVVAAADHCLRVTKSRITNPGHAQAPGSLNTMLSFAVIATSLTATYPVVILLFKRHITTHAKTYIEKIICDWAADQVKDVVDDVQDALGIDDDDDKKKAEVTVKTVEMADPSLYTYPSPLAVYAGKEEELEPLSEEKNEDGKSLVNPVSHTQSDSYGKFSYPLDNGIRGGL